MTPSRNRRMPVAALAAFLLLLGIGAVPATAADGPVATLRLRTDPSQPDESFVFWKGGQVGDDIRHSLPLVGDPGVSTCENSPCFAYTLDVASVGVRLRIAIDVPTRNDNFLLQVTPPGGTAVTKRNSNAFNGEVQISDPPVGTYAILVRPYSTSNSSFAMRAKLDAELPTRAPNADGELLPDLRPTAPYEFGFIAPLNPLNGVFPPDDVNPPADVAGVHPVSCAADETAEDGATKCLRLSFGLTNMGPGNFDLRWQRVDQGDMGGPMIQCVERADSTPTQRLAGEWAYHPTHFHTHYQDVIFLKLLRVTDAATGTMVAAGDGKKLGYSPADQAFADWHSFDQALSGTSGDAGNCAPETNNRLGMSVGWGDVYRYQRPGNYVNFGTNPNGLYVVQLIADPTNKVKETNDANNTSYAYIRVTGDVVDVLEWGRGQSPWDPTKTVLKPRFEGGVPW